MTAASVKHDGYVHPVANGVSITTGAPVKRSER
jgi:hypothetical protein